uniref:ATP synthase complex subunit 8 n=1 Tax=Cicadellidae gen. sp. 1 JCX-2018 TaxID=2306300 RepID=A0A346RNI9_9HEMI|nr:ATP synthase F0 subunit 8 [Cicadellidae gen. sp. 1 JCX-2018]
MPQMAPMWWLSIMITTAMIMMIFITINYFIMTKLMMKKTTDFKLKKMNWKW